MVGGGTEVEVEVEVDEGVGVSDVVGFGVVEVVVIKVVDLEVAFGGSFVVVFPWSSRFSSTNPTSSSTTL